jgi:putative cell wall-binding protein
MSVIAIFSFCDIAFANINYNRLTGTDRYEVSSNIAKNNWSSGADTIIIVSGEVYSDALPAATIAYKNDAPILLVRNKSLPQSIRDTITGTLKPKKAIIIGGEGTISKFTENELRRIVPTVTRIGGINRYEISKNISEQLPATDTAVIVSGSVFADALSIGPFAAKNGYPIFLTRPLALPVEIEKSLVQQNIKKVFIIGGYGSVSKNIHDQLKGKGISITHITGQDRYEVASKVATTLEDYSGRAFLATGLTFGDALTASVPAAKKNMPILLARSNIAPSATQNAIYNKEFFNVTVLGGTGSLPEKIINSLLSFKTATFKSDGTYTLDTANYSSFQEAALNISARTDRGVLFGKRVLKVGSGTVKVLPITANLYSDSTLSSAKTYVPKDTQLIIQESTDKYIKVKLADSSAYMKLDDVEIQPWIVSAKVRDKYAVNSNGDLLRYFGSYSLAVGKAPSKMIVGKFYYSSDGYNFYNDVYEKSYFTSYRQYFQYLPVRTKTKYTAQELLSYVNSLSSVTELERRYNATHAVPKTSPFRDIKVIQEFINAQNDLQINALFIFATAAHESGWGLGEVAVNTNNLFSIKAFDSNTGLATKYADYRSSIRDFALNYMAKGYSDPSDWRYNSSVVGHKTLGFNVKYASDPDWGQKIAGHMYRADKFLGKKDTEQYKLAFTKSDFNIRSTPSTSGSIIYTVPRNGFSLAVLNYSNPITDNSGYKWYKVISDKMNVIPSITNNVYDAKVTYKEGYIRQDGITFR